MLRVPCEDVAPNEVGQLIELLENELVVANKLGKGGIGLAAPQIGIYKKIAIIRLGKLEHNLNLINCKIKQGFDPSIFTDEGCLSFPGRVENTTRFQEIHVIDNLVYPYSFIASGLSAVVCQHEIDHYYSTLFIDHLVPQHSMNLSSKIGSNQPCPCNSGKKYKRCCKLNG